MIKKINLRVNGGSGKVYQNGETCSLQINIPKIPQIVRETTETAEIMLEWATVIEAPSYSDPDTFGLEEGRSYYTLRPIGTTYPDWISDKAGGYSLNDIVKHATTKKAYKSLINENSELLTNGQAWEQLEEIRIYYVFGDDNGTTVKDIRHYIPWYVTNSIVPYVEVVHPVANEKRYYIWAAFTFCGTNSNCSLRWNQTQGRAMAVFK